MIRKKLRGIQATNCLPGGIQHSMRAWKAIAIVAEGNALGFWLKKISPCKGKPNYATIRRICRNPSTFWAPTSSFRPKGVNRGWPKTFANAYGRINREFFKTWNVIQSRLVAQLTTFMFSVILRRNFRRLRSLRFSKRIRPNSSRH